MGRGGGSDKSVAAHVEKVQVPERAEARGKVHHQVVRQHQHPAASTRKLIMPCVHQLTMSCSHHSRQCYASHLLAKVNPPQDMGV